jgi:peptidoglycan/xylan/chitin deacetylase (PgdA/CDA1 family)
MIREWMAARSSGLERRLARWSRNGNASRINRTPIVSFTFDDFPRSALENGGALLERYGFKGTYYACLGLMNKVTELGELFAASDLRQLVAAGHELGCHTYGHESCRDVESAELRRSCDTNRRKAAELLDGYRLGHFAFPNGHVTVSAKSELSTIYKTLRCGQRGVNRDPIDLILLRANAVDSRYSLADLKILLEKNTKTSGWTILYMHDIRPSPSRFGCTIGQFHDVISMVIDAGAEVMTVGEAASRFFIAPIGKAASRMKAAI